MSLKRVSAFLTQNNPLHRNQSSFRSGHSTETALLSVVEALRLANADSKSPILILQDLSSAFDTVNHRSSCQPYWERASQEPHTSGLSLTSQIGPLTYLGEVRSTSVYMASLGSVIQKHCFSYHADDTQLYLSFHPDDPTIAARISAFNILQVNDALLYHPKEAQNHFHRLLN